MPITPTPAETLRAAAERTTDPALAGLLGKLADAFDHHGDGEAGAVATLVHAALPVARRLLGTTTADAPSTAAMPAAADANRTAGVPQPTTDDTDIVAYRDPRHSRVLLCRDHGARWHGVVPVTAQDLPDGGICTFGQLGSYACGRDVLIAPAVPATPEEPKR